MQLLVGHGSNQRLERSSLRLRVQSTGTDPLDEATHDRIRVGQVSQGFGSHGNESIGDRLPFPTQALDFIGDGGGFFHIPHLAGKLQLTDA